MFEPTSDENKWSNEIIGSAIHVHSVLGPGLLEKVYEECLSHVLFKKGFTIEKQKSLPVHFEDIYLDAGFKIDLLVNDAIVLELKTVERLVPVHEAQLQTYLKLSGKTLGLLINFNTYRLKDGGIKRIVMTKDSLRS